MNELKYNLNVYQIDDLFLPYIIEGQLPNQTLEYKKSRRIKLQQKCQLRLQTPQQDSSKDKKIVSNQAENQVSPKEQKQKKIPNYQSHSDQKAKNKKVIKQRLDTIIDQQEETAENDLRRQLDYFDESNVANVSRHAVQTSEEKQPSNYLSIKNKSKAIGEPVENSKQDYSIDKNGKGMQNPISKQSTKMETNTLKRSNTKDTLNTDQSMIQESGVQLRQNQRRTETQKFNNQNVLKKSQSSHNFKSQQVFEIKQNINEKSATKSNYFKNQKLTSKNVVLQRKRMESPKEINIKIENITKQSFMILAPQYHVGQNSSKAKKMPKMMPFKTDLREMKPLKTPYDLDNFKKVLKQHFDIQLDPVSVERITQHDIIQQTNTTSITPNVQQSQSQSPQRRTFYKIRKLSNPPKTPLKNHQDRAYLHSLYQKLTLQQQLRKLPYKYKGLFQVQEAYPNLQGNSIYYAQAVEDYKTKKSSVSQMAVQNNKSDQKSHSQKPLHHHHVPSSSDIQQQEQDPLTEKRKEKAQQNQTQVEFFKQRKQRSELSQHKQQDDSANGNGIISINIQSNKEKQQQKHVQKQLFQNAQKFIQSHQQSHQNSLKQSLNTDRQSSQKSSAINFTIINSPAIINQESKHPLHLQHRIKQVSVPLESQYILASSRSNQQQQAGRYEMVQTAKSQQRKRRIPVNGGDSQIVSGSGYTKERGYSNLSSQVNLKDKFIQNDYKDSIQHKHSDTYIKTNNNINNQFNPYQNSQGALINGSNPSVSNKFRWVSPFTKERTHSQQSSSVN